MSTDKDVQQQELSSSGSRRRSEPSSSSEAEPSTSISRPRTKVRTGCKTCKVRRLKCDETKPACKRCTSTGRLCDGYGPSAITSLPFDIPGSDEERRGFHYFRLQTTSKIFTTQDVAYWTNLLIQLSYSKAAVKHALVAIASIHEAWSVTDWSLNIKHNERGRALRMLSWRQYNEAIQNILQETNANRMPLEILLVFCLLFNQYEIFQCDYWAAYAHIKSGQQLLLSRTPNFGQSMSSYTASQTSTVVEMINDHIMPMIIRLDVQASLLMHGQAPPERYTQPTMTVPPNIPRMLESFAVARQLFDHCASWMFYILAQGPEICNDRMKREIRDVFEQWWVSFTGLIARTPVTFGGDEDKVSRLLRVYYNFARITLDTYHDSDELGFDSQTERFNEMINFSQDQIRPNQPGAHLRQSFSFDMSSASPLYFVASRCRVPHIRRQAITMLQAAEKCSWNCEHSAMIAQMLVDVEEAGLDNITTCEDIPRANRVRRLSTKVNFEEGHIEIQYISWPYTDKSPVNVATLPLRTKTEDSVERSDDLLPASLSNDPSSSTLDSDLGGGA